MSKEKMVGAKEFAKEHWPGIMAATTVGASIILLIQYYRNKSKKEIPLDDSNYLNTLAEEAEVTDDKMAVILETGESVMEAIPESAKLTADLAEAIDNPKVKETMGLLSQLGKKDL